MIVGTAPVSEIESDPFGQTMLFDMLQWAGMTKRMVIERFYIEYCVPSPLDERELQFKEIYDHFISNLIDKLAVCEKVIVLGPVAQRFFLDYGFFFPRIEFLMLPDPDIRYYNRIMDMQSELTYVIKHFLYG